MSRLSLQLEQAIRQRVRRRRHAPRPSSGVRERPPDQRAREFLLRLLAVVESALVLQISRRPLRSLLHSQGPRRPGKSLSIAQ